MENKEEEGREKEDDIENSEEILDDLISDLDSIHEQLTDKAAKIGFARDAVQAIKPLWRSLINQDTSDPDTVEIYSSGFNLLKSVRDQIHLTALQGEPYFGHIDDTSASVISFVTTSGSTAAFFDVSFEMPDSYNLVFGSPDRHQHYQDRFSKFDQPLGNTYQGIWEVLYGTRTNPEKGALYLIRDSYDQLFRILAPDDEVRDSPFWKPKDNEKHNQIYRHERLEYAANTHIKNEVKRKSILESSKHMLSVYEKLNQAHANEVNPVKARKALEEMRSILEEWADAIGI